jgi:hypothetical protein
VESDHSLALAIKFHLKPFPDHWPMLCVSKQVKGAMIVADYVLRASDLGAIIYRRTGNALQD